MFVSSLEVALEATPELAREHPDFKAWTERNDSAPAPISTAHRLAGILHEVSASAGAEALVLSG